MTRARNMAAEHAPAKVGQREHAQARDATLHWILRVAVAASASV